MKLNFNTTQATVVDDEKVSNRRESGEFEGVVVFSDSEKAAMKAVADTVERLHAMDSDRAGWLSTLLEKTTLLVNAATQWQEAKLKREQVALELAKLKLEVRD